MIYTTILGNCSHGIFPRCRFIGLGLSAPLLPRWRKKINCQLKHRGNKGAESSDILVTITNTNTKSKYISSTITITTTETKSKTI